MKQDIGFNIEIEPITKKDLSNNEYNDYKINNKEEKWNQKK